MCVASVPGDQATQKRPWGHLKLELQMFLSCCARTGSLTQVLYNSSQGSKLLSQSSKISPSPSVVVCTFNVRCGGAHL